MLLKRFSITRACAALAMLHALALPVQAAGDLASSEQYAVQAAQRGQGGQGEETRAQQQGRLYRVTRGQQVGYLFGTVHVGDKSFFPLAPEVSRALADASELVVELDTRANDAFERAVVAHGAYRQGDDIRRHLTPSTLALLTSALHEVGTSLNSVAHLKPWLLANILQGLELQRNGYERTHGVETFLLANASRQGTAVTELESADYQLALFDTLTDEDSERYLLESLRALSDGTSLRKARTVLHAWRSGDAAALNAVIADATSDDGVVARFTRATLLGRRNPEMAARIERIMNGGGTAFVGVGLLHLLGANGLPQLLAQRGYQVERVY
jgi:uncharacterized protein YbaP (TraB family)